MPFRSLAVSMAGIALLLTPNLVAQDSSPADNWPSFRGPVASVINNSHSLPTRWDGESGYNIKWKTEIPGLAHSSPVIWRDRGR